VWAEKNPDEVKMIADEGHDVANHSYSHYKMSSLNSSAIKSEILKCDRVLKKSREKMWNCSDHPMAITTMTL